MEVVIKDAYYFSHDANARHDPKMLLLRAEFGDAGYAHYFMILEMMRESHGYKLKMANMAKLFCHSVAISLNITDEETDKLITKCCELELFKKADGYLFSESLLRRMGAKEKLTKVRREAGRLGAMAKWQNNSKPMAVKERKGKERKETNTVSPEALRLANVLAVCVKANNANTLARDLKPAKWAGDIDKLFRIDKQSWLLVEKVLLWSQQNSFWKHNIKSGFKLRDKWSKLTSKMEQEQPQQVQHHPSDYA